MSEKESEFIKLLKYIVGSLILTIIGGAFMFYSVTIQTRAAQEEKNKSYELGLKNQDLKTERMRTEWREDFKDMGLDFKEVKMNIDAIRESQVRDKYNNVRYSK